MSAAGALAPKAESLPFHPIAECWPLIDGEDFRQLADDIRAHGLIEPITLYEGAILDGRNRYRACQIADVAARFVTYDGIDPVAFAKSKNDARRHLSGGQRAMVAARLANLGEGRPEKTTPIGAVSIDDAAHRMNVSPRSVDRAREVVASAAPEIIAKVDRGELAVSAAAEIARQPVERQREIADWSPKDIVSEASDLRRARAEQKLETAVENLKAAESLNRQVEAMPKAPAPSIVDTARMREIFGDDQDRVASDVIFTLRDLPTGDPVEIARRLPAALHDPEDVKTVRASVRWLSAFADALEEAIREQETA